MPVVSNRACPIVRWTAKGHEAGHAISVHLGGRAAPISHYPLRGRDGWASSPVNRRQMERLVRVSPGRSGSGETLQQTSGPVLPNPLDLVFGHPRAPLLYRPFESFAPIN
jgi:hypothetical protein